MGSGSLVAARLLAHLGCHAGPPPLESRSRRGQEAEAGDGAEQRRRPPAGHGAAEGSAAAPAPAAGRLLLAPCGGGATVTHPPRGRSGPCLASGGVQGRGGAAVAGVGGGFGVRGSPLAGERHRKELSELVAATPVSRPPRWGAGSPVSQAALALVQPCHLLCSKVFHIWDLS